MIYDAPYGTKVQVKEILQISPVKYRMSESRYVRIFVVCILWYNASYCRSVAHQKKCESLCCYEKIGSKSPIFEKVLKVAEIETPKTNVTVLNVKGS